MYRNNYMTEITMNHAVEEYVGQIRELKESVASLRKEMDEMMELNLQYQQRIRDLESQLYGGRH